MPQPTCRELLDDVRVWGASPVDEVDLVRQSRLLAARVEAVLALHQRQKMMTAGCVRCIECGADWPCPTRRALEGEP